MKLRGSRLACSLRTQDGCLGSYSAYPGETPKTVAKVDPVQWDKPPQEEVLEGRFSVIGDMGMTGQMIFLNQSQWRTLTQAKLEQAFYAAILWGGNGLKVVEDAILLAKRSS